MSKVAVIFVAVALGSAIAPRAMAQSEQATPPAPPAQTEAAPPPMGAVPPLVVCPPLSKENRINNDLKPGLGNQVAGGIMVGMGLASLIAGSVIAAEHDQVSQYSSSTMLAGGTINAVAGGISAIVGIPLIARGRNNGHKAQVDNARLTMAPLMSGGATARLGFNF